MLICITNRRLCQDDFLHRIEQLARGEPQAIMLREKDLRAVEYENLAQGTKEICDAYQVPLIISHFIEVAQKMELPSVHLSMEELRHYRTAIGAFSHVGASVHSVPEAREAEELGATYLIAGHIFPTACKQNVPPRGLSFLQEVCNAVTLPVYAIGGITKENAAEVIRSGARGFCLMSEAMTSPQPAELVRSLSHCVQASHTI